MKHADRSYVATLLVATFFMGSSFIASKLLLRDLPPFWLVGWRFVTASLALLPVAWLLAPSGTYLAGPVNWKTVGAVGLLQTTGTMGLLFLAMQTISASTAAILLFTNPLWVALLGFFLLRDRLTRQQVGCLLVGILGVALALGVPAANSAWLGYAYGLGSGICWACSTLVVKRWPARLHPLWLAVWQMGLGGALLLVVSWLAGEPRTWPSNSPQWGWFAWLAVPASAGSFGLWLLALQRGGAAQSSSFLFLAPLFATALSVWLLDTSLSGWQYVGATLTGLAIYALNSKLSIANKQEK